jgi:2-methylcitrate dehydratase PrpD
VIPNRPGDVPDSLTARLAGYVAGVAADTLPPDVLGQARLVLADTVGVLLASGGRVAARTALAALGAPQGGPCTVLAHGRVAGPQNAAFVNGIAGHDLELDDFHAPSRTHPAAVLVPAALAAAEVTPCTYGDLLAALVAGYDAECRLAQAIGPEAQFARGFHPSGVCGAVGAAVTAGRILGLTVEQLTAAIALAAGQSSGLMTVAEDHSHMAKSFQTGVAARNGVTAALFARNGYRAAPDVLDGRHDMLRPFGGDGTDPAQLDKDLGERYEICATTFKRHACCALTHPAIDALLDLLPAPSGRRADRLLAVDVQLAHEAARRVDGNELWTHNLQYLVAVAATQRRIEPKHFQPRWTRHPELALLAHRVTVRGSDELQVHFPERQGAIVTLTTPAGEYTRHCEAPRGSPDRPLTEPELAEKFLRLNGLPNGNGAATLWRTLLNLDPGEPAQAVLDHVAQWR